MSRCEAGVGWPNLKERRQIVRDQAGWEPVVNQDFGAATVNAGGDQPADHFAEPAEQGSYTDDQGRLRWHENDRLGELLSQLGAFLVIAGYEPSHAARYGRLAHTVSRHPQPMGALARNGRLRELPGVGPTVAEIISELVTRGSCRKLEEWAQQAPITLLELLPLDGLGPMKIRQLWTELGVKDLASLREAIQAERVAELNGFGPATVKKLEAQLNETDA